MSRKNLIVLLLVALLGAALLGVWSARKPIARDLVDRTLAEKGVVARYDITHFGFRTQRLENVVIGDPARPDLTARRIDLRFGFSSLWPAVRAIDADGVRLRGRIVSGKLSLGMLDRLMPEPTGEPFALPNLSLTLRDARMRLDTPWGALGLAMAGSGNVANSFSGQVAAVADGIAIGGCNATRPTAYLHVVTVNERIAFDGPVRMAQARCGEASVQRPQVAVDVTLGPAFDRWNGGLALASGPLSAPGNSVAALRGRVTFQGNAQDNEARVRLSLAGLQSTMLKGGFAGMEGTPLAPFATALGEASRKAARALNIDASLHLAREDGRQVLRIAPLELSSQSGARLALVASGRDGISVIFPGGTPQLAGRITIAGGGFPDAVLHLRREGGKPAGSLHMAPWVVDGGKLAVESMDFGPRGASGRVRIDGPLGDGRIEGLVVPVDLRTGNNGAYAFNPGCTPVAFTRLEIAGMRLGPARLPLCAINGGLLVRSANGQLGGGGAVAGLRLTGAVGDSPLSITARRLSFAVARPGFAADRLGIRLGENRLDLASLDGDSHGGRFAGAAGKIGVVPLLASGGAGRWRFDRATLGVSARLDLDDAEADPRFHRLVSEDFALTLKDSVIRAQGTLHYPGNAQTLSAVRITHDLSRTTGSALLDVPGIRFGPELQPDMLTRLALGVIANVKGVASGQGRIFWDAGGVRSDGDFATEGMDLAAAFGPVSRLKGRIHFSDLIALETPPGQEVLLGEVNPGVAVENGVIRYQLLKDQMVRIESGDWPFSGGKLVLEPTMLDFGRPSDRNLTFRVEGMDAALFVQQFEFKNIAVTGIFDGVMPMVFDAQGGRIVGGRMVVRPGGGTLAYVGELSNEKLGRFAGMAFDALKSIRYDNLAIELDGSLDGEIVSRVIFNGVNKAPIEKEKGAIMRQITGLPFRFNIKITAPFRSLLNSAQSINDPRGLVSDAIARQRAAAPPVQPKESETLP